MKKFISAILLFTLVITSAFTSQTPKPRVEVFFNKSTGFSELVIIKAKLEKQNIFLDYKKIEYNKKGELVALSFSVDCMDGFSGSASTDNIPAGKTFGFYRDYSDKSESPFGTGGL